MTLQEYLNQEEPEKMANVKITHDDYGVTTTFKIKNEICQRVYFKTTNPLLAGMEYFLMNGIFYTIDGDGNPKERSCFSLQIS